MCHIPSSRKRPGHLVIDGHCTVRSHDVACDVLIITIFACEHVLVDFICVDDIAVGFGYGHIVVPHHAVADKTFAIVGQDTALQQM